MQTTKNIFEKPITIISLIELVRESNNNLSSFLDTVSCMETGGF
jgi:hypothetical protein